jgi:hypothetical protein
LLDFQHCPGLLWVNSRLQVSKKKKKGGRRRRGISNPVVGEDETEEGGGDGEERGERKEQRRNKTPLDLLARQCSSNSTSCRRPVPRL